MRLRLLLVLTLGWFSINWACTPTTHSVTFNWTDAAGVRTYNLVCGAASGKELLGTPINSSPIKALTYTYKDAPAGTFYCEISVVGTKLVSNERSVTVP
jgi:hypothetical protein